MLTSNKYAFTFGYQHINSFRSLRNRYVVIEGSFSEARKKLIEIRGSNWAFQYPFEEFLPQIKEFKLVEIALEDLVPKK